MNNHAPLKERRVKKQVQPEWFNEDIQQAMYLRDKYCSANDRENFIYWRSKASELKRKSKSTYYKELIIANKNDSKKLWKLLNELAPKHKLQDPVTLRDGETILSDPQDICESFNTFFTNIASSLTNNMPPATDDAHTKLRHFIESQISPDTVFDIPQISVEDIQKELSGLEDSKAVGLDGIPPKLLRLSASIIARPLSYILNQSITTGIFPDEWKVAKVVPLHKKDSTQLKENFRPISVLSTLSKLLEHHVHKYFYKFLIENKLLHLAQSGFRAMFSCETALANIVNKWTSAIDDDKLNGVVLLDLRKAFDLIDHKILLKKLQMYQCSDKTMKWFTSYLESRSQCTIFKGKISEKSKVNCGVPQGSILGPLFFILFINDLPLYIENSECDMYADDSSITSSESTVKQLEDNLNEDMKSVSEWCSNNSMLANAPKTKVMLVTTWQKRASLPENDKYLQVKLNDTILENVDTDKLLGVMINNNLSWENHINSILSKVNRNIALLRRIKRYLTLDVRKMFFNANVLPHLDYCSIIWGNSPHMNKLYKAQKRAARVILDVKDYTTRSCDMFKALNWMPLQDRVTYRKACMVYKSLNGLAPKYMTDMFQYVHETHQRDTRTASQNKLSLPDGKHKDVYTKSFGYDSATIWNNIPSEIRNSNSLQSFKSSYLSNYFKHQ